MKTYSKLLLIFFIIALFLPMVVSADGMMIAPPDRYIYETGQKAVIFYEKGIETLIVSTNFKGDAENFAWVIPTPAKPEVSKGSQEIFTSLDDLTRLSYEREYQNMGLGLKSSGSLDAVDYVRVIEEKKIDYYDIAVLESNNKEALSKWLNDNGYNFPEQYSHVLNSYIENKWVFTAAKITKDVDPSLLKNSMWQGQLIPLVLRFPTDAPVYPLKISSIIQEPNKANSNTSYTSGKIDRALKVRPKEKVSINANTEFNLEEGSIEAWVNIEKAANKGGAALASIYDISNNQEVVYFFYDNINRLNARVMDKETGIKKYITASNAYLNGGWHYVSLTWKQKEYIKIYVDGNLISQIDFRVDQIPGRVYNSQPLSGTVNINIGSSLYGVNNAPIIEFDEFRISDRELNALEIQSIYNEEKSLAYQSGSVIAASFNNDLSYYDANSNLNYFIHSYTVASAPAPRYTPPTTTGIILYIFTPKKEQYLPGFSTSYASWIKEKTIEDLALDDNGKPLLDAERDKYYLTKLTRNMKYSEMTNDLFFRDADKNSDTMTGGNSKFAFFVILFFAFAVTSVSVGLLWMHSRKE